MDDDIIFTTGSKNITQIIFNYYRVVVTKYCLV